MTPIKHDGGNKMKVKVKLFAFLAEEVAPEIEIDSPATTTVENFKQIIATNYPSLADKLDDCRIAINQEFVQTDKLNITSTDEIALIPPVSGG